jgi:hypothetical protein
MHDEDVRDMPDDDSLKDCLQAGTNDHYRNNINDKTLDQHCVKDKIFHGSTFCFFLSLYQQRESSNIFERIRPLFLRADG